MDDVMRWLPLLLWPTVLLILCRTNVSVSTLRVFGRIDRRFESSFGTRVKSVNIKIFKTSLFFFVSLSA